MINFMERNPDLRRLFQSAEITLRQVQDWTARIEAQYQPLGKDLPTNHAWRMSGLQHAREGADEIIRKAKLLGLQGTEVDLISFVLFCHDIGRLVQAGRNVRKEPEPGWLHGTDSIDVITSVLDDIDSSSPLWQALLLAIQHHSDSKPVTQETVNGNQVAWALATLLRDFDKKLRFKEAESYTQDQKRKHREIEANWPQQRQNDPIWGEEKEAIVPAELLESFERHQLLDRNACQSYEAYMLQYLAWVFDVVNPEVLTLIVQERGPAIVLQYLQHQLNVNQPDQYERISQVMRDFFSSHR